jgi:hypothetical protein
MHVRRKRMRGREYQDLLTFTFFLTVQLGEKEHLKYALGQGLYILHSLKGQKEYQDPIEE